MGIRYFCNVCEKEIKDPTPIPDWAKPSTTIAMAEGCCVCNSCEFQGLVRPSQHQFNDLPEDDPSEPDPFIRLSNLSDHLSDMSNLF